MHKKTIYKFSFEGDINDDVLSSICNTIKQSLETIKSTEIKPSKILSTVLELLDNAQRYGKGELIEFEWLIEGNKLAIRVSNVTDNYHYQRMENAVNTIKSLTEKELRESYKLVLNNGIFNGYGGAGLGYMKIARNGIKDISLQSEPLKDDNFVCTCKIVCSLN